MKYPLLAKMTLFCGGIALALYLLYRGALGFDLTVFAHQLREVSVWRLSLFALPFAVSLWTKWLRWLLCIRYVDPTISGRTVWRAQLWGYCASNTLPFKAGEAVKMAVLKKEGHVVLRLLPTIALDRFWDGAVLLLLLLAALPFFAVVPWVNEMAVAAAVLFVGGLLVFCGCILLVSTGASGGDPSADPSATLRTRLSAGLRDQSPEKKVFFSALLRKVRDISKDFALWIPMWVWDRGQPVILGLSALRSWRLWAALALLSIVNWLAETLWFAVVFWSFGLSVPLAACMVAVAAVNFASLVIAVPAAIGVFEFCVVTILVATGVSSQMAFGIAVLLHGVSVLPLFGVAGVMFFCDYQRKLRARVFL